MIVPDAEHGDALGEAAEGLVVAVAELGRHHRGFVEPLVLYVVAVVARHHEDVGILCEDGVEGGRGAVVIEEAGAEGHGEAARARGRRRGEAIARGLAVYAEEGVLVALPGSEAVHVKDAAQPLSGRGVEREGDIALGGVEDERERGRRRGPGPRRARSSRRPRPASARRGAGLSGSCCRWRRWESRRRRGRGQSASRLPSGSGIRRGLELGLRAGGSGMSDWARAVRRSGQSQTGTGGPGSLVGERREPAISWQVARAWTSSASGEEPVRFEESRPLHDGDAAGIMATRAASRRAARAGSGGMGTLRPRFHRHHASCGSIATQGASISARRSRETAAGSSRSIESESPFMRSSIERRIEAQAVWSWAWPSRLRCTLYPYVNVTAATAAMAARTQVRGVKAAFSWTVVASGERGQGKEKERLAAEDAEGAEV